MTTNSRTDLTKNTTTEASNVWRHSRKAILNRTSLLGAASYWW
jgi:hypothetical protein